MAKTRNVSVQDGDQAWLGAWHHELQLLCGMVREMVVEEKRLLLSPVMRELLGKQAALVEGTLLNLQNYLCVDNLGKPLQERMPEINVKK